MSGVIHPVGPEPARTYWVRRGVLVAIVLVLAVFVAVAVANLTRAAVVTAPPPAPVPLATSPTPTPTGAAAPGMGTSPSPSSASTPSKPSSTPTMPRPTSPAPTPPTSSAKPRPTTTIIGTPDCRPTDLRVALEGDTTLKAGQKNRFTVTLTNAGTRTCLTSVTVKNFELRVSSGKDRIWSTADCAASVKAFDKKLAAERDVAWTVTWDGRRSVRGGKCDRAPETPRPGTYRATAELEGADPVQLRMVLR